jgi:methyl-accepting chemotaxis protein
MGQGYTVDTASLATRIGELRALAETVAGAATAIECPGQLGPDGIVEAALREVADQWRDGLDEMSGKLGSMADNVDNAVTNYQAVEQAGAENMHRLAEGAVTAFQLNFVRGAAAVQLARQDALADQIRRGGRP